ncbi:unnamed protein product [Closterium sp. NIES-54]
MTDHSEPPAKVENKDLADEAELQDTKPSAAESCFSTDLLRIYYRRLFPYADMARWLSYGNDRKLPGTDASYLQRREFSFTLEHDIYVRYQSFRDAADMEAAIRDKNPHKIDIGAVYNVDPARRAAYQGIGSESAFAPVERELVFDIDISDYDDVRTCCSGASVCTKCWPLMTAAIKVVDTALREDFGFEHILWVFSGRRGVHCWVCDRRARRLTNEQRSAVAEYFRVYKGTEANGSKVSFSGAALHPSLMRAYDQVLRGTFEGEVLPNQELLSQPDTWKRVLNQLPDQGAVCVPIDPANCADFEPSQAPTLSQLVGEINAAHRASDGSAAAATAAGIESTSLAPFMEIFRSTFLRPLLAASKVANLLSGRFSQRAQWGLHLGIEINYNAWKIFDVHSKETVAARDVIFYERLTLPTYLANLEENRDPTGGFRGDRHFGSAADEADWDEQNVGNASEEAGPLPHCSVPILIDDENPRDSVNAETYFDLADTGYVTPAEVNTNEAERIGPNFIPDPETGDEAAYPADTTLPRYTQSGLQILGLVTAVHGTDTPKEPATVEQALGGEHKEKWREAMDKELKALQERNTWKVVPIGVARNKTILTGKWVFRVKTKADGTIDKFKARWVVRGFDQEHGRDFTETFAPVSRHTSLRILLAVAAMKKKKLRQIDVANAFLYAPVDAEIYVKLPHGSHGEPNQVCQLQKSLYEIKQAPRLWQQNLHARLTRIGFKQLPHDQGMYRFTKDDDYILLIVYVDDLLYIGSTDNVTTWFEGELQKDLTLTVSSTVTQYLGLNIQEGEDAIYLNAAKYADTIAKRFALTPTIISTPYRYTAGNDKAESALLKPAGIRNYQRKLGCLLFAAVTCRPDLSYSASQLATYLKRPEDEHMKELDRALHYLDEIEKGRLELSYCPTSEMAADYLTKKLGKSKFEYCMLLTGQSHVTYSDTPEVKGSVGNN